MWAAPSAPRPKVQDELVRIPLSQLKLGGEVGRRVEIRVKPSRPGAFPPWLRIPRWTDGARLHLPGWAMDLKPGRFARVEHEWSGNDTLVLELPLQPRFVLGRQRQAGRVALMRGPLIYGFNLDANPEATLNGKRTFHDLRRLLLDPTTLSEVLPDDSVRPGGTAFRIKAWPVCQAGSLLWAPSQ